MSPLTIEMLPAREGDCLLVTYGAAGAPRRLLIDGGRAATYKALKKRLAQLPPGERELELLVVTHIDRDHIEGTLELLEDKTCPVTFKDIWFNGYAHLSDPEATKEDFGAVQGERLTTALLARPGRWNAAFARKAVCVRKGKPVKVKLAGGMTLTVLSPDATKMAALVPVWEDECAKAGIDPNKTKPRKKEDGGEIFGALDVEKLALATFADDGAEANGSAIGFLCEWKKARVLFGADCHVDRVMASLDAISPGKRVALSALKVAHHGSEHNLSTQLLGRLDCPRYLISTNGNYFQHPTRSAIARILKHGGAKKEIFFNYRSKFTEIWDAAPLMKKYGYQATYPAAAADGTLVVEIPA